MEEADTVVVGAGIAGLAAAWRARERGERVVVLEASARQGGRMWTREAHGCRIDAGAQFVSTGYATLGALAAAVGVRAAPIRAARAAIRSAGRWRRLRATHPRDLLPILGVTSAARYGWAIARHARALRAWDPSDLARWAPLDTADADAWLSDPRAEERLVRPLLEALYFQEPRGTSQVLPLMVHAFSAQGARLAAWPGGMDEVPAALAARLDVRYGQRVSRIGRAGAAVTVDGWRARRVICATPAPVARALWPDAPELEQALLATDYSRTVVVSLVLDRAYVPPSALDDVYGAWIPAGERRDLAAFTFEDRKHPDRAPDGVLLNAMTTDAAAAALHRASDAEIVDRGAEELEPWLPGLTAAVRAAVVTRWAHAEPRTPVGRARAVAAYRARGAPDIALAGDYVAAPWTDGAAESGRWAAGPIGDR